MVYNEFYNLSMLISYISIYDGVAARKVENVWVSVISSTYIGLRWNIDCTDRIGLIGEYQIFYCAVVSTKKYVCNGKNIQQYN